MIKIKIPVAEAEIKDLLTEQGFFNNQVRHALTQAKKSHRFHKATGGEPFLEYHLYPVVYTLLGTIDEIEPNFRPEAMTIAFLHDVIEDDPAVDAQVLSKTFPPSIVNGVIFLTRQPGHDEGTDEQKLKWSKPYIKRLMDAPHHVRLVKLADRAVNLQNNRRVALRDGSLNLYRIITETETLFLPLAKKTSNQYFTKFKSLITQLKLLDNKKA